MTLSIKLKQIRNHVGFKEIDAMFIINPKNIMYLLGFKIESETLILIPNEDALKCNGDIKTSAFSFTSSRHTETSSFRITSFHTVNTRTGFSVQAKIHICRKTYS